MYNQDHGSFQESYGEIVGYGQTDQADPSKDALGASTAPQADPAPLRKKRNAPSRRSVLADRQFLREFKTLSGIPLGRVPSRVGTFMVDIGEPISSSSPPAFLAGHHPSDPIRRVWTRTPALWRDTGDELQGFFAHEALKQLGGTIGVTAHLNHDTNAAAYAAGAPLNYLRKRIADALRRAFGHPVEFVLALEEEHDRSRGVPVAHLHGEFGIDPSDRRALALARRALRTACGAWTGSARNRQIRLSANPNAGWAGYATKRTWLASPAMRTFFAEHGAGPSYCLAHDGPVLTMSNGIRRIAKAQHEKARQIVQDARQRPKVPETEPSSAGSLPPAAEALKRRASQLWQRLAACRLPVPLVLPLAPRPHISIALPAANRSRGPPQGQSKLIFHNKIKMLRCAFATGRSGVRQYMSGNTTSRGAKCTADASQKLSSPTHSTR